MTSRSRKLTPEQEALVAEHHAFKVHAAQVAHLWGYDNNLCNTFDTVLINAGLPGRGTYYRNYGRGDGSELLAGEDTVEAFEAWKASTVAALTGAGVQYGYGDDLVATVLREAGFDVPERTEVEAFIEGTFKVPVTVTRIGDEPLIDAYNRSVERDRYRRVGYLVNSALNEDDNDSVTWKLVTE